MSSETHFCNRNRCQIAGMVFSIGREKILISVVSFVVEVSSVIKAPDVGD